MVQRELHAVLHDGPPATRDRRIDAVVTRIRHKLSASPYRYLHSHRGVGYRFDPRRASHHIFTSYPPSFTPSHERVLLA